MQIQGFLQSRTEKRILLGMIFLILLAIGFNFELSMKIVKPVINFFSDPKVTVGADVSSVIVATEKLYLRHSPIVTKKNIIRELDQGIRLEVIGKNGDGSWFRVKVITPPNPNVQPEIGWVKAEYVERASQGNDSCHCN